MMALSVQQQAKYWGIAAIIFCVVLWYLGDVILPFVLGGALAYCLDPLADRLERLGMGRAMATTVIMLTAFVVIILLILAVFPLLFEQTQNLIATAPELFSRLRTWATEMAPMLFGAESGAFSEQWQQLGDALKQRAGTLINGILSTASGLVNVMVLAVLVPVITFYLLLDWDRMVARIDALLPREHAPTLRRLAKEIDMTLASFIRGQGLVCVILGSFYAIALMSVGLNFGLLVGFTAGIISFIPYVGALVGGLLAIGLAIFQYWGAVEVVDGDTVTYTTNWMRIGIVIAIFMVGQFLEGNILSPKLVGGSVGLHPVWLIFALSVFGALFGFVGLLVAVPVAAIIGVLTRFGLAQYQHSYLYRGPETMLAEIDASPDEDEPSDTA